MYGTKKRGFSYGLHTKTGTEMVYVWFSTDNKNHVDCSIADEFGTILARGVACLYDGDEFSITEGEDIAFDKALSKLYTFLQERVYREKEQSLTAITTLKNGLNKRMREHLIKEEKIEQKIRAKNEN